MTRPCTVLPRAAAAPRAVDAKRQGTRPPSPFSSGLSFLGPAGRRVALLIGNDGEIQLPTKWTHVITCNDNASSPRWGCRRATIFSVWAVRPSLFTCFRSEIRFAWGLSTCKAGKHLKQSPNTLILLKDRSIHLIILRSATTCCKAISRDGGGPRSTPCSSTTVSASLLAVRRWNCCSVLLMNA